MTACEWLKERIIGNPRSTVVGIAVLAVGAMMWLGAERINAITENVTALSGLVRAVADGWQAVIVLPLAGWFIGKRD